MACKCMHLLRGERQTASHARRPTEMGKTEIELQTTDKLLARNVRM